MKRTISLSSLLFGAILLSACALPLLPERTASMQQHRYVLDWTPATPAPTAPTGAPILLVSPIRSGAGYAGSDMIYMREAHELQHFAYHRWADSPAHMLEPLVVAAAKHSGRFRLVLPAGSHALTDLRLDTRLLYLRQVFSSDAACRVELGVRVDLIRVASGLPLGEKLFSYKQPCVEATPQAGVMAANRAVADFLEDLGPALSKF